MAVEESQKRGQSYCPLGSTILDSSLITATLRENLYNVKLVNCGDYVQAYYFENKKQHKINNDYETLPKVKNIIEDDKQIDNKLNTKNKFKTIEQKNIIRSKLQCQRIAKCNAKDWCTFITLTFSENQKDLDIANKKYKQFVYKIKRVFKNFMCLAVPEFQKRGAVHYHLLTNIDINNSKLIYKQIDNNKYLHVKYWNEGFNSVENVKGNMQKIIGYISKYMTKDIDNRLFGHHRYFCSGNLKRPTVDYIDLDNPQHLQFYNKMIKEKDIIYDNIYLDNYTCEKIAFCEFLKIS